MVTTARDGLPVGDGYGSRTRGNSKSPRNCKAIVRLGSYRGLTCGRSRGLLFRGHTALWPPDRRFGSVVHRARTHRTSTRRARNGGADSRHPDTQRAHRRRAGCRRADSRRAGGRRPTVRQGAGTRRCQAWGGSNTRRDCGAREARVIRPDDWTTCTEHPVGRHLRFLTSNGRVFGGRVVVAGLVWALGRAVVLVGYSHKKSVRPKSPPKG